MLIGVRSGMLIDGQLGARYDGSITQVFQQRAAMQQACSPSSWTFTQQELRTLPEAGPWLYMD
jgi:hypothetical protein